MADKIVLQWKGGCVHCGEKRRIEAPDFGQSTQVYLIRENGNKTIVGLCERCYGLDKLDYERCRSNLAHSEIDYASVKGDKALIKHAQGFSELKFVGHEKRG